MITKWVIFAQWFAAGVMAGLTWFYAQATTLDTAERLVGGAGIAAVAIGAVYITLRASMHQRDAWSELLANERSSTADARVERDKARRERDEYRTKYDEERRLRMSLEELGLTNRRRSVEDKEHS